jgi:hypothetical protein
MKRPIKLIGKSYDKFGEKFKKILEVDITKGLSAISLKGNKLFLLIRGNDTRVIHYDIVRDTITLDQTFSNYFYWDYEKKFPISDNLSFLDLMGNYYKYNQSTNSYDVIDLGYSGIQEALFLEDRILVQFWDSFNVYDLDGNLITSLPIGANSMVYDKTSNKAYSYFYWERIINEIDLNDYSYRTIELPTNIYPAYNYGLRRIPNTNKLMIVSTEHNKIYLFDLDTSETTELVDLKQALGYTTWIERGYITEDCKIVFLGIMDQIMRNYSETYIYDVEKGIGKLAFSTGYLSLVVGNDKLRKYVLIDVPYSFIGFIYDYNNDKIDGVFCNASWNDIYTDGNLWGTI